MAYVGANLIVVAQSLEGSFDIFSYSTTDSVTTVTETNYFSDGAERGMSVGDWIFLVAAGYPYLLYVSESSGLKCTAESASLSIINGNLLPTVKPPSGSGALYNNGGFVCIA